MKIAIFSDTFYPQLNGVANVAFQSAKLLSSRGHQVKVFTVGKTGLSEKFTANGHGFDVIYVPSLPSFIYPGERVAIPGTFSVFNKLKFFAPDIIHSHTPLFVGLASIIGAKLSKAVLIGTHHTFYDHYLKHIGVDFDWAKKISWKATVAFYNRCQSIISPSRSLAQQLVASGLKKPITVLSNSIDTDFFRPLGDSASKTVQKKRFGISGKSFVYMGRVSYEKSIDKILHAFALVCQKSPNYRLTIIGDGPEKPKLETLAKELGIADKVVFTGFLEGHNLLEAIWANNIFVTASKSENMPLSVLEAMATGLPIIAVKEKGLAEMINDGENGFLVKTDDINDMAEKMLKLISSPKLLKSFSANSRRLAMNYSEEKIGDSLEKVYLNALAAKQELKHENLSLS